MQTTLQALFLSTITGVVVQGFRSSSVPVTHKGYLVKSHRPLRFGSSQANAPINIMPHYPPYGQKAGNIGALTKGGCPYSRAFDYL